MCSEITLDGPLGMICIVAGIEVEGSDAFLIGSGGTGLMGSSSVGGGFVGVNVDCRDGPGD